MQEDHVPPLPQTCKWLFALLGGKVFTRPPGPHMVSLLPALPLDSPPPFWVLAEARMISSSSSSSSLLLDQWAHLCQGLWLLPLPGMLL